MPAAIKFGTDGWRAVMGEEYTLENVERVAQGFADHLNGRPGSAAPARRAGGRRVVIGFDTREHSEEFAGSFARVLLANGITPVLSNAAVPTPAVSRAVIDNGFDAGIAITASHNPGRYNGVKIKDRDGSSADPAITRHVEELIDTVPVKRDAEADLGGFRRDILTPFLDGIRRYANLAAAKDAPFRILVDSMHGAGGRHIECLLEGGRVRVTTMRGGRDTTFGGVAPEPIARNLAGAIEKMKSGAFDLAVVTDGDADRIGALRPGGAFVSPGTLLSLLMLHLAEDLKKTGSVVTTVSNTSLIYRVARKLGLKVHETPVGFKHICEIIRRETVLIAGEESGGLAFHRYMPERDGILSALLLVQMMGMRGRSFEEILSGVEREFGRFYYVRVDLRYSDPLKPKLLAELARSDPAAIGGLRVLSKKTLDGVKFMLEGDAWLLFRLSGTEPLLRVYAEATDPVKADALVAWGRDLAMNV